MVQGWRQHAARAVGSPGRHRSGRGGVHVHYALHIPDDAYDAAVAHLRQHGNEPHEEDFGENGPAAYVTDPDGNVVELWTWAG
jgi:catechol 2,3-dioxygenase-like lactoylglutathione lyase family enzyme